MKMKVLVACEYSGKVRDSFTKKGHEAWSCDLLPSDQPDGNHYQGDIRDILYRDWDLIIAHLWLKNLPKLVPTNIIKKERYSNQTPSGQNNLGPSETRWKERSVTYQGIADAMANQWGGILGIIESDEIIRHMKEVT